VKAIRFIAITLAVLMIILLVAPLLVPVAPLESTLLETALADSDSRFVLINGINVHYKQLGSGEPVMILLHGFGASVFSWREVMAPLANSGTVIAFDRPAFGLTQRPMPGEWQGQNPYSPEAQVALVIGLMDALEIDQAILIGNSAGGTVALSTVLAHPQRISGLVLVDAAVYSGGGAPAWIRPLFWLPQYDRIGQLISRSLLQNGDRLIETAWHDPTRISPEVIEGYQKPLLANNWDRALWELTQASNESGLADRLGEVQLPVLVVSGDDDRLVPTDQSVRLSEEIDGARLVVFATCGHVPQEECPDQFLQAVQPFVVSLQ
jgi:pimeloyl-ACP methyl ester carboxylesterase